MHVQPATLVPTLVELFITYIALFPVEYAYYFCNNMVRYKTGIFRGIIDARNYYDGGKQCGIHAQFIGMNYNRISREALGKQLFDAIIFVMRAIFNGMKNSVAIFTIYYIWSKVFNGKFTHTKSNNINRIACVGLFVYYW